MSINDIISIIIPCYNDAVYIEEAVQSAISQTWGNKEIIVVDDGSNMETKRVLKELEPKIDLLITQENKGLSAARNIGIENAKGDFIVLLDSDDFFEPEFCEKALPIISEDKSVKIVTCYARRFNENGVIDIFKPAGGDIKNFLGYNAAIGNSMIRKQDWGLVGKYDESMQEGFEDWEFYIRLLKPGGYAYVLEEALFNYRQKKKSMRGSANKIKYELQKYIYFKHQNLYKQYFEVFVEHLLGKIEREEREKIKHTQRLEFRLGKAFLNPLRRIKRILKW
ncbi:glycosyltransferase family A protein [Salegentibacter sp. Hel_I_6]|uniref:glycosyltransferase family 2 protein n=1 Tax=Salegentibacter sp. Hel_I_6 TaxID=1250278 RepID=UPI00055D1066|nr:glycosyltransferase family A protein [Salegentibacter sp. Hel_I_6]